MHLFKIKSSYSHTFKSSQYILPIKQPFLVLQQKVNHLRGRLTFNISNSYNTTATPMHHFQYFNWQSADSNQDLPEPIHNLMQKNIFSFSLKNILLKQTNVEVINDFLYFILYLLIYTFNKKKEKKLNGWNFVQAVHQV